MGSELWGCFTSKTACRLAVDEITCIIISFCCYFKCEWRNAWAIGVLTSLVSSWWRRFRGAQLKATSPPRERTAPSPGIPAHSFPLTLFSLALSPRLTLLPLPASSNIQHWGIWIMLPRWKKKASRPFFSQSLAVSTVPKARREKSPGCSLPTTLTYSLDKLWEIKHFHNHYNNWCCSSSCLSYDKWWAVLPGLPYVRSLETFQ